MTERKACKHCSKDVRDHSVPDLKWCAQMLRWKAELDLRRQLFSGERERLEKEVSR